MTTTQSQKDEFVDRVDCVRDIVQMLLVEHPASVFSGAEMEVVQDAMNNLYQRAGAVACGEV